MCDDPDCAYDADEHHPDEWEGERYTDSNGRDFNPYQGSVTPTDGRCNAPLSNWQERYGEPRYCMQLPEETFIDDGSQFCKMHKSREDLMERASELFTHGVYAKTIKHVFERLEPWQKLTALGWYDSYVRESTFDFEAELQEVQIDFADFDGELPLELVVRLDGDEQLSIAMPVPTEHEPRCFALFRAALMDLKTGLAERAVFDTDDGTAVMEKSETLDVIEDEDGNVVDTIDIEDEHHLNVPISRIDGDKNDLLAFGGVPVDSGADVEVNTGTPDELVFDLGEDEGSSTLEGDSPVDAIQEPALAATEDDSTDEEPTDSPPAGEEGGDDTPD